MRDTIIEPLDVVERRLGGVAGDPIGIGRHEPEAAVAHREHCEKTVAGQKDRQLVFAHRTSEMQIPEHIVLRQRRALERQAETPADPAVRTVGGDQIRRLRLFFFACRAPQLHLHTPGVFGERHHLHAAIDLDALPVELLGEKPLGLRLREEQYVVELTRHPVQFDGGHLVAARVQRCPMGAVTRPHEILTDASDAKEFDGAGLDAERPGCQGPLGGAVDDTHVDTEAGKLDRRGQPGRSGADDQDGCIAFHGRSSQVNI